MLCLVYRLQALVYCFSFLMLCAPAAKAVEMAEDNLIEVVSDQQELESVLVASRKAETEKVESHELEPIAVDNEYEPELADPEPTLAPPSAEEESKQATKKPSEASEKAGDLSESISPQAQVTQAYRKYFGPKPAKFHGVTPGITTAEGLAREWGDLADSGGDFIDTPGGRVVSYPMKPFKQVEALIKEDIVQVVRVTLARPASNSSLIDLIGLDQIDPVEVIDPDNGELIGLTFPEKGVTLLTAQSVSPEQEKTSHLILQPLDAQAFALRAERRNAWQCEDRLADLKSAVMLDPKDAYSQWMLAKAYLYSGQDDLALEAAEKAVELDSEQAAYRLTMAKSLAAMHEYDKAVLQTRTILDDASAPDIVRAEALSTFGRLASLGEENIAKKAINFHKMAIALADQLATSADDNERRIAKRLLVESHLDIARGLARSDYDNKADSIAEWIERASSFAEEAIENDSASLELRLLVAREALGSLAEMRPTKNPGPWVNEAKQTAASLIDGNDDSIYRAKIDWELGLAYAHAARAWHTMAKADEALEAGAKAIDRLSAGAEPRAGSPEAEVTVGKLYFAIGAVNAVHKKDHEEAVVWYDKARPILEETFAEPSTLIAPRYDGERLVSMAVSYWQVAQRDLALDLTKQGAKLMEEGVRAKVLEESALAVPYTNLKSMHTKLGNTESARRFASLAREVQGQEAVETLEAKPTRQRQQSTQVARNNSGSNNKQPRVASNARESNTREDSPAPRRRTSTVRRPTPRGTIVR